MGEAVRPVVAQPGLRASRFAPAVCINWDDAKAYVEWLSRKTGKTYRLLAEAEREYVARAGTTTPFWWGSSISTSQANYDGHYTYDSGPKGEYRKRTVPVEFLPAEPVGALSGPWQCVGVGGRLLERQLPGRSERRLGPDHR